MPSAGEEVESAFGNCNTQLDFRNGNLALDCVEVSEWNVAIE